MAGLKKYIIPKNIGWLLLLCLLIVYGEARQSGDRPEYTLTVEWVGHFSSSDDLTGGPGFFEKVYRFIFGAEFNSFRRPFAVWTKDGEEFWVLDQGTQTPVNVSISGEEFEYVLGHEDTYFPSLVSLCSISDKEILFTDSGLNRIFLINSETGKIIKFKDDLNQPTGIAYNSKTKEVWVAETASHRIAVLDLEGNILKYVGRRGSRNGEFNFPTFLWIDENGTVYVVDSMNFRVQIFDGEGRFLSKFGEPGDKAGFIASPKGIATDSKGHIYLVDARFHMVQMFDREGNFLFFFGGFGSDDSNFWMPIGIHIDSKDIIYVADSFNSRIQIFELTDFE